MVLKLGHFDILPLSIFNCLSILFNFKEGGFDLLKAYINIVVECV